MRWPDYGPRNNDQLVERPTLLLRRYDGSPSDFGESAEPCGAINLRVNLELRAGPVFSHAVCPSAQQDDAGLPLALTDALTVKSRMA